MLREYKGQRQLDFLEPYDRITSSIDNWCLGSREVNFLEGDHNTHNWHFYVSKEYENGTLKSQKLMLEREDKEFIYEVYDFRLSSIVLISFEFFEIIYLIYEFFVLSF